MGKVGRKTVMTDEVVAKLETAFKWGCNITEAANHAEIHRDSIYEYIKKNPEFSDKIKAWQEKPILKARKKVVEGIEQDHNLAFKYLSKKRANEFKEGVQLSGTVEMASEEDILKKIKDANKGDGQ